MNKWIKVLLLISINAISILSYIFFFKKVPQYTDVLYVVHLPIIAILDILSCGILVALWEDNEFDDKLSYFLVYSYTTAIYATTILCLIPFFPDGTAQHYFPVLYEFIMIIVIAFFYVVIGLINFFVIRFVKNILLDESNNAQPEQANSGEKKQRRKKNKNNDEVMIV